LRREEGKGERELKVTLASLKIPRLRDPGLPLLSSARRVSLSFLITSIKARCKFYRWCRPRKQKSRKGERTKARYSFVFTPRRTSGLIRLHLPLGGGEQLLELAALFAHRLEDAVLLHQKVVGGIELDEVAMVKDKQTIPVDNGLKAVSDSELG
jgi:hypothetical protein